MKEAVAKDDLAIALKKIKSRTGTPLTPKRDDFEYQCLSGMYRAFTPELKAALKIAAERNGWLPEDWPMHIRMVFNALSAGLTAEVLAHGYLEGVPPDLEQEV